MLSPSAVLSAVFSFLAATFHDRAALQLVPDLLNSNPAGDESRADASRITVIHTK
jgi:hypothetical protein